jgi:nitroreductase
MDKLAWLVGAEMPLPKHNDEVIEFLLSRRSSVAATLGLPGPTEPQLTTMLTIAARVPDHRKLVPFRFLLIEGEAALRAGEAACAIAIERDPSLPGPLQTAEKQRFTRAPTVLAVIFTPNEGHKTPVKEQLLTSGIAAYNLVLAANSMGFGAQWITEWLAEDRAFAGYLGLAENEQITGFVHIGTCTQTTLERPRPELADILSRHD